MHSPNSRPADRDSEGFERATPLAETPAILSRMAALNLPDPYARIDQLIEQGQIDAAKRALSEADSNPALRELIEVKLGLLLKEMPPQIAMNRLLVLMRQDSKLPGAQDLYREASRMSYQSGASSLAHSHPPPPPDPGDQGTE